MDDLKQISEDFAAAVEAMRQGKDLPMPAPSSAGEGISTEGPALSPAEIANMVTGFEGQMNTYRVADANALRPKK